ncbi:MAG: HAD family phosphatase [Butyrivibrio sp.]|nr:HAD family phosphatase [Butyrivibrio sp.]
MESDKLHDKDGNIIPEGQIKTVIFDIGNVLVNFEWKAFIKSHGGYDDEMSARIGKASVENHSAWDEFDLGNKDLKEIVDGFVAADPEIEKEIRSTFTDLEGIVTKRDEAIPWIKAVKAAGYKVLVLSNYSSFALEPNGDAMGFLDYVDGGILSYRDHVIKPDPAIYKLLMSRYDLKPEECVFIDDTEKNIVAAKKLGIHGIIYKNYQQVVADLHELGVNY